MSMKNLFILLSALVLAFTACEKEPAPVKLEFASQTYQMTVGQTIELAGELIVENSDKKPSFSSSDSKVASVSRNGKVTANEQGTAVSTAEINILTTIDCACNQKHLPQLVHYHSCKTNDVGA